MSVEFCLSPAKRQVFGRPEEHPSGAGPDLADPGAEAKLVLERVGRELSDLALALDETQVVLGPFISVAAFRDPALMRQAQTLDLATQSLRALSTFLAAVGGRRIGRESLDLDDLAATLTLKKLGDRLAGRTSEETTMDLDLF